MRKKNSHGKKLPPPSAWGHYRVRRGKNAAEKYLGVKKETVISVRGLCLGYEGRDVVKDLSFDIKEGEYISIIGENGSGKSTLLSALLDLKSASSGEIEYIGLKRNEVGVLPQQDDTRADFPITVFEVVSSGCIGRYTRGPFMTRKAREVAFANMEKMGITSLADSAFGTLSGGQKQRALLSRALCAAKKLLVLDEPVTGLDPKTVADIYSLVSDLNRYNGMTVICVTHDIPSALKYSSHILRLDGSGHFFGTVEEYLSLDEVGKYTDCGETEKDEPYGDGGFRYSGGAT